MTLDNFVTLESTHDFLIKNMKNGLMSFMHISRDLLDEKDTILINQRIGEIIKIWENHLRKIKEEE